MQELLTIATYEMKEEDMEAQCLFWDSLNEVMEKNGCKPADFCGFMADEAQANWNAIRHVFNNGKDNILIGRERSCLFHWEQSMVGHTIKYIVSTSQFEHKQMCEKWRMAPSRETAASEARLIRQWWRNGNCMHKNLPTMDSWLSWWEVRIAHWGNVMIAVERSNDHANTPRTNLAESKHGSWLAGEGFRRKISLYDACTTNMANVILQSTKAVSYSQGKHIGKGPSLENLKEWIATRPTQVVRTVNEATEGTPLYKAPTPLTGDKETSRHKRKSTTVVDIEDGATHRRPEYNAHSRDRKSTGRPRKINFKNLDGVKTPPRTMKDTPPMTMDDTPRRAMQDTPQKESRKHSVIERKINEAMWAIRRTTVGSKLTCSGTPRGGRRCGQHIAGSSKGVPVPSFEGYRKHPRGLLRQWMWFCPDHVLHCYVVDKQIDPKPCSPPKIWPVNIGTNLQDEEVQSLLEGGYEVEQQQIDGPNPPSNVTVNNNNPPSASCASSGIMQNGIRVKYRTSISEEAEKKITLALQLNAKIIGETCRIEHRHEIFKVESRGDNDHMEIYDVHIKDEPSCTCPDFAEREVKKRPYLACKHLYFVFLRVLGLSQNENMFIH